MCYFNVTARSLQKAPVNTYTFKKKKKTAQWATKEVACDGILTSKSYKVEHLNEQTNRLFVRPAQGVSPQHHRTNSLA